MLETPPTWAIAIVFWLHMLATVVWLGSLATIAILILPSTKRVMKPAEQLAFIENLQSRLEPIAWFSIAILIGTGLFQMSINPQYDGFLSISGNWALAMLTKHLIGILVIVVSAFQTWEVLPAIRRGLMRIKKGLADKAEILKLQKRGILLIRINLGLSIIILAATAFARAS